MNLVGELYRLTELVPTEYLVGLENVETQSLVLDMFQEITQRLFVVGLAYDVQRHFVSESLLEVFCDRLLYFVL